MYKLLLFGFMLIFFHRVFEFFVVKKNKKNIDCFPIEYFIVL